MHVQQNLDDDGVPRGAAAALAALVSWRPGGKLTATQAKTVLGEMAGRRWMLRTRPRSPPGSGSRRWTAATLETLVDEAIAADPDAWAKFCAGDGKAMGALVGLVMKASKGKADGKAVTALLNQKKG